MTKSSAALRNFAPATSRGSRSRHTLLFEMAKEAEELAAQGRRIAELRSAKARREGQRVTQPTVADAVGVGLRAYQLWEAGDGDIDPENRKALADYFDTTPEYIEYGIKVPDRGEAPDLSNGQPDDLAERLTRIEDKLDQLLKREPTDVPAAIHRGFEDLQNRLGRETAKRPPRSRGAKDRPPEAPPAAA